MWDVKYIGTTFSEDLNEISFLLNCKEFVEEILSVIDLFVNFALMEHN